MKEFIDKLIVKLEELQKLNYEAYETTQWMNDKIMYINAYTNAIAIVNELAEEYINTSSEWIACSERLPEAEERVLIFAKRKYKGGGFRNIITTAIYEDGTVLENDSNWHWEDIDGEWDEEEDCYIIPEGWWEDKAYNPDGELNHAVDDEVIAWMPLPEAYKEGSE